MNERKGELKLRNSARRSEGQEETAKKKGSTTSEDEYRGSEGDVGGRTGGGSLLDGAKPRDKQQRAKGSAAAAQHKQGQRRASAYITWYLRVCACVCVPCLRACVPVPACLRARVPALVCVPVCLPWRGMQAVPLLGVAPGADKVLIAKAAGWACTAPPLRLGLPTRHVLHRHHTLHRV